jgi:L,D-transpeptidase YcbB
MRKIFLGIAAAGLLTSCQQVAGWFGSGSETDSTEQTFTSESINKAKMLRDESITRENAYSDLFLDSAALENYIRKENMEAGVADRMREFYIVRSNQFAWFTSEGVTEQARGLWSLYASEDKKDRNQPAARIERRMDSLLTGNVTTPTTGDTSLLHIDNPASSAGKDSLSAVRDTSAAAPSDSASMAARGHFPFSADDTTLVQTELALTAQYVNFALENKAPVTTENFYWLVPRKKVAAMQLADSLLNRQKDSSLWQNNRHYQAMKNSLQQYYTAAKEGGWQAVPSAASLQKGAHSPAVTLLKRRLAATGDYPESDTSSIFTDSLAVAVRAVQEQYGFAPTGLLTDSLLQELNIPAEERVQQILVNMNRALWLPPVQDSSYIMVNIPSQELVVYSDTSKRLAMPVIVGKEGAGTMAFSDQITKVVFSPYWNVPQSIMENEIKPALKKDPAYLKKHNMEIVKQEGSYMEVRQLPGKSNSLGQVKFLFPNSYDIYLHDTPHKEQFAQQNRALSHGCIRVARPPAGMDAAAHQSSHE